MHIASEREWTLEAMAELSHLSRSAFAHRFSQLVGEPSLVDLTGWRMGLARSLLTEGKPQ